MHMHVCEQVHTRMHVHVCITNACMCIYAMYECVVCMHIKYVLFYVCICSGNNKANGAKC